jgi:hypothetical protein
MNFARMTKFMTIFLFASFTANANLFTNGSFEQGDFVDNTGDGFMALPNGSTAITGWTVYNDTLSWGNNSTPLGIRSSDGYFFLDLTGGDDTLPHAGVSQTIGTTAGKIYTVSFDLGTYQTNPNWGGPVSLLATAGSTSIPFTFDPTGSGNQWDTFSFDFVASSSNSSVSFQGLSALTESYIGLDNAKVSAAPIPAAVWLFTSGLVGLGLIKHLAKMAL